MKKCFVFLIFLVFLIAACTQLPPEPGAPGQPIGKALAVLPDWASDPSDKFFVTPETISLLPGENGQLTASVRNQDFIYKTGYIYKNSSKEWVQYTFPQSTVGNVWIRNSAEANLTINRDEFNKGENYIVAYACKKEGTAWNCNGNKWMLQTFNLDIIEDADLSQEYCESLQYKWIPFNSISGAILCCGNDADEFVIESDDNELVCCSNSNAIINEDGECEVLPEVPGTPSGLETCTVAGNSITLELNKQQSISEVKSALTESDLQSLLKKGTITNDKGTSQYSQKLSFDNTNSEYVNYLENDEDITDNFLYIRNNDQIAKYDLNFETPFKSDILNDSLTGYKEKNIEILGKKYTIVDAKHYGSNSINLILFKNNVKATLVEGGTETYNIDGKDYEVVLNFVSPTAAKFTINGETTRELEVGQTDKLADGTNIGIVKIFYTDIHVAEFYLGTRKIELKDTNIQDTTYSNALKVDDNTIDEALVTIQGTDNDAEVGINSISVEMKADDDFYVAVGEKLSEAIKSAGGITAEPEVLFTQNWDIFFKNYNEANDKALLEIGRLCSEVQKCPLKGDVNNDSKLDCSDADCIVDLVMKKRTRAECPCSDVNDDGESGTIGDVQSTINALLDKNIKCLKCNDSDSGRSYYVKGQTYGETARGTYETITDRCEDAALYEFFCDGITNFGKAVTYTCPNGCENGACVYNFNIAIRGDEAILKFKDNNNNLVTLPLLYIDDGNLKLGDNNKDLITEEGKIITKDDYLILTNSEGSYALQYKGADKITSDNPVLKFKDLGSSDVIEQSYNATGEAILKLGGSDFKIINASENTLNDFDIRVDLNADGAFGGEVNIVEKNKASISINNVNGDFAIYIESSESYLKFRDNDNNLVTLPLLYIDDGNLKLGNDGKDLITEEGKTITKNDYLILTTSEGSYALQYKGADKITSDSPVIRFRNLGDSSAIDVSYTADEATLMLGDNAFKIVNASTNTLNDFDISVDLNADGNLNLGNESVEIVNNVKRVLLVS